MASGHPLADLREGASVLRHSLLLPILITSRFNTAFAAGGAPTQSITWPSDPGGRHAGDLRGGHGVGRAPAGRVIGALPFGVVIVIGPVAGWLPRSDGAGPSGRRPSGRGASFLRDGWG
jgi:hypothetical protein